MTRAQRKLIEEILTAYCVPENRVRECANDLSKAFENPRKYRRDLDAEVRQLASLLADSLDADGEIIGHRD